MAKNTFVAETAFNSYKNSFCRSYLNRKIPFIVRRFKNVKIPKLGSGKSISMVSRGVMFTLQNEPLPLGFTPLCLPSKHQKLIASKR